MTNDDLCLAKFAILANRAQDKGTITYSSLGTLVGVHHRSRDLHQALGSGWQWCQENQLPHLNALVVRKSGNRRGIPGSGYTPGGHPISRSDWQLERDAVHGFDWSLTVAPTEWPEGYCGA